MRKLRNLNLSIPKVQGVLLSLLINANILTLLGFPKGITATVNSVAIIVIHFATQKVVIREKIDLLCATILFLFTYSLLSLGINPNTFAFSIYIKYLIILAVCYIATKQNLESIRYFIGSTVALNIALSVVSLYDVKIILSNQSINYLTVTYALGISFIYCFISSFTNKRHKIQNAIFTILLFAAILMYPSRGTILFSLFVCLLFLLYRAKSSLKMKFLLLTFVLAATAFFFWLWESYLKSTYLAYRFIGLFTETGDEPRIELYQKVLLGIKENWLWGVGIGNSSLYCEIYPHNIFMEAWLELGIVGVFVYSIFIFVLLKKAIASMKVNDLGIVMFFCFLYGLLNFQKSFSIQYSQYFVIFPCFSIALLKIFRNNKSSEHRADI
ncbi:MAG: O-antigen ligase family protein [Mangrovibacterium sp.]